MKSKDSFRWTSTDASGHIVGLPCFAMWSSPGSLGASTPRSPGSTRGDQVDTKGVRCNAVASEEFVAATNHGASTGSRQPSTDQLPYVMITSVTPAALSLAARLGRTLGELLITLYRDSCGSMHV